MLGEIYLCQFPFTNGTTSKPRPAIVLFDLGSDAIIARITSTLRNGPLDITLVDWSVAGLLKPSVVRLDRIVTFEKQFFYKKLGNVTAGDEKTIRDTWNLKMKL